MTSITVKNDTNNESRKVRTNFKVSIGDSTQILSERRILSPKPSFFSGF